MPIWVSALLILGASLFYCYSCIAVLYGYGNEALNLLQSLFAQADVLTAFVLAVTAITLTLKSAIPGQEHLAKLGVKISAVGIAALFALNATLSNWVITKESFIPTTNCFLEVALFAALPIAFTFYLLKKAAPTDLKNTGRLAVLGIMFIGYIATRLSCSTEANTGSFLTHVAPLVLYAGLGGVIGKRILKW